MIEILTQSEMDTFANRKANTPYISVVQRFDGQLAGSGIVSFSINSGKTLVEYLMDSSERCNSDFGIPEKEAISEVGNVIINAVQGAISDMAELETQFELPSIHLETSIIPKIIAAKNRFYIIGQTVLSTKNHDIQGTVMLVYTYKNIEILTEKFIHLYKETL